MSSEDVDMLSLLPEDILSHILSSMPTIYAVRTSILSKRWRYRWIFVTNIDFDDSSIQPFDGSNCNKFVDRVLDLCETSQLNLFRLRLPKIYNLQGSTVSTWIEKAVRLNVNELDINVHRLQLPLSLWTCKALTKLRMDSTYHDASFVKISELVTCCPMLESLSFQGRCGNYKDEEYYLLNSPTLKRLEVTWEISYRDVINKGVLRVPNLEYLFVGGTLDSIFVMEDVSSLVKASLSINEIRSYNLWVELLKGISGVKSLSVQSKRSTTSFPPFPNMKHLELKSRWSSRQILHFLKSSPRLEYLYIEELERSNSWTEPKLVPSCMLTNLTTIMLSNCEGAYADEKFLEYMIVNAKVLKILKVSWKYKYNNLARQLCANLTEVQRASSSCEIIAISK